MKLDLNNFDEKELILLLTIFGIDKLTEEFSRQLEKNQSSELNLEYEQKFKNGGHITVSYSKNNIIEPIQIDDEFLSSAQGKGMPFSRAQELISVSQTVLFPQKLRNFFTDKPSPNVPLYLVTYSSNQFLELETPVIYNPDKNDFKFVRAENTKRLNAAPFNPEKYLLIYWREWEKIDNLKPKKNKRKALIDFVKSHNFNTEKEI